jgi:hypothetical protein
MISPPASEGTAKCIVLPLAVALCSVPSTATITSAPATSLSRKIEVLHRAMRSWTVGTSVMARV